MDSHRYQELASMASVAGILLYVRLETGQGMIDILMAHLPSLF